MSGVGGPRVAGAGYGGMRLRNVLGRQASDKELPPMTPLSLEEIARRQEARRQEHDRVARASGSFGQHVGTKLYRESEDDLSALLEMAREILSAAEDVIALRSVPTAKPDGSVENMWHPERFWNAVEGLRNLLARPQEEKP